MYACRACSVCVYKCVCIIWLLLLLLVVVVVLRAALSPLLVAVAVLSVGVAHWRFGCTLQAWQLRLGLHFGSLLGILHTACAAVHSFATPLKWGGLCHCCSGGIAAAAVVPYARRTEQPPNAISLRAAWWALAVPCGVYCIKKSTRCSTTANNNC